MIIERLVLETFMDRHLATRETATFTLSALRGQGWDVELLLELAADYRLYMPARLRRFEFETIEGRRGPVLVVKRRAVSEKRTGDGAAVEKANAAHRPRAVFGQKQLSLRLTPSER